MSMPFNFALKLAINCLAEKRHIFYHIVSLSLFLAERNAQLQFG